MSELVKMKCGKKEQSLDELAKSFKYGLCSEEVCHEKVLNDKAVLLCFEEYYLRCGSYVALSVMMVENDDSYDAIIVGFGGGDGVANISWGANSSYAGRAVKALEKLGFEVQKSE